MASEAHNCTLPYISGLESGANWMCPSCRRFWVLREGLSGRDWRRPWHPFRAPKQRQAEPIEHDLIRECGIREVLDGLKIDVRVLEIIRLQNPSADLRYHGYQHLITTALNAAEGSNEMNLSRDDRRVVVVAALWHDFDYILNPAGGDKENVMRAMQGYARSGGRFHLRVANAIRATEFPHGIPDNPLESILQDADLMQGLEPDGQRWRDALERESGKPALNVREFAASVTLNTDWARRRFGVAE